MGRSKVNQAEMEKEVARRTGLPLPAVRLVVSSLKEVMSESIRRQQDVVFRGLFRITCVARDMTTFRTAQGSDEPERQTSSKLIMGIRPVRAFRKELNKWTSTPSS